MPTEEEFHDAWDVIQDFIKRLGDECEEPTSDTGFQLEGKDDEDGETYGMFCSSTDLDYHIVGHTHREHFSVVHRYDFREEIADRLNDQDAVRYFENSDYYVTFSETEEGYIIAHIGEDVQDIQLDPEETELDSYSDVPDELIKLVAADIVIEDIDTDLMEELKFRLRDRISSPHTYYSLMSTGTDAFYGFVVGSTFFPFEPDFGIENVHNAWTQTRNVANSGTRYLTHSFNLERQEEEGIIDIGFQEDRIHISG